MIKRLIGVMALFLCAVAGVFGQSGSTTIVANHISYFGGVTITGKFCVTPTDQSGNPITIVTSLGQQVAPQQPLCFPITAGVLSSAVVPDTSMVQPVNACYNLTISNFYGAQVADFPCIQPSTNSWSFDSYIPSSTPTIPALSLPQYQVNGTPLPNQNVVNFTGGGVALSGNNIALSTVLPSIANNAILGNVIGSTAQPVALTSAQVSTLLGYGIVVPVLSSAQIAGSADSYAALQAAFTAAQSGCLEVYVPAGAYKTSAGLTYSANCVRIRGAGSYVASITASATGYNTLTVGNGAGNQAIPTGYAQGLHLIGAGRSNAGYSAFQVNGIVGFKVDDVTTDMADIGFDLINNCYGAQFSNIRGGFGGTNNVTVYIRTGPQSGSDISLYNAWIAGQYAAMTIAGGAGGIHIWGGQFAGGEGTSSVNDNGGSLVMGQDYLAQGTTGEATADIHGTSFEGTNYVWAIRSYDQILLNLDAVSLNPAVSGTPAIGVFKGTNFKNGQVSMRGTDISGYWSGANLAVITGSYGTSDLQETGTYSAAQNPTIAGTLTYVNSIFAQSGLGANLNGFNRNGATFNAVNPAATASASPQITFGNASLPGYAKYVQNGSLASFFGMYDTAATTWYGISTGLPFPSGTTGIAGFYSGMGIQGTTNNTNLPLFGILSSTQSTGPVGLGYDAFTVYDTNKVVTYNNTLDDGSGNLTAAGSVSVGQIKANSVISNSGITGNINYYGGSNSASSSSALGSAILGAGVNTGTGAGPSAIVQAGANSSTGAQGFANTQQSFTIAAATTIGHVEAMTTTADKVQDAALGSTSSIGVATSVGGTNTQLYVATEGKVLTVFDGTPVVGDFACAPPASTGTAGLAHDNGTTVCPPSQGLGIVTGQVSGTGSGATATVLLQVASPDVPNAAACLAAATVTSPCIAYQANATGLSATFSGTAHTLYTTSAPANGVFEFCPTLFQDSGTGTIAGQAQMVLTWTTAGGTALSNIALENIAFGSGGGVGQGLCQTISTQANSTLSVNMTTSSGTGTVTWDYDLVVRRLK